MRILTVIPISRGISKDFLTYFTNQDVEIGSIVSIPLRKKTIFGLVTASREATEVKSEIKSLSYSIKKIDNIEARTFLSSGFIKSAEKIADYNAGSVGAVLSALIPKIILEESSSLSYTEREKTGETFHETVLLQSDDEERYATYRSVVREEFAKNRSLFFCLPTTEDLLNAKGNLEKDPRTGVETYTPGDGIILQGRAGQTIEEFVAEYERDTAAEIAAAARPRIPDSLTPVQCRTAIRSAGWSDALASVLALFPNPIVAV